MDVYHLIGFYFVICGRIYRADFGVDNKVKKKAMSHYVTDKLCFSVSIKDCFSNS